MDSQTRLFVWNDLKRTVTMHLNVPQTFVYNDLQCSLTQTVCTEVHQLLLWQFTIQQSDCNVAMHKICWLTSRKTFRLHKKKNASRRREFFRRWTVSLKLSACRITWQRYLTCTVWESFEDTLVCVGLRRKVTCFFALCTNILTYLHIFIKKVHLHSCCSHYSLKCHRGALEVFHKLCRISQSSRENRIIGNDASYTVGDSEFQRVGPETAKLLERGTTRWL